MPLSIDLIPDEGSPPHYDPHTQRREKITRDGVEYWQITTLTFDEIYDTEEQRSNYVKGLVARKLAIVDRWIDRAVSLNERDAYDKLNAYKQQLSQGTYNAPEDITVMSLEDVSHVAATLSWQGNQRDLI